MIPIIRTIRTIRITRMTRTIPTSREAAEAVAAEAVAHAEAGAEALDREIPLMITRPMPLARKDSGKALAQMEDSGPLS